MALRRLPGRAGRLGSGIAALAALLLLCLGASSADAGRGVAGPVAGESVEATRRPSVPGHGTDLRKGLFLVASRKLVDPNFRETVVLIVDHGADGTRGLIVNRPTDIPFADTLPEVKALQKLKDTVYLGGPVARYLVSLLVRADQPPEDMIPVFGSVYFSHHLAALLHILERPRTDVAMRAYVGHAGWAPGQLDHEIRRGDWHIAAGDAAAIFDTATDRVWPTLIDRLDPQLIQARVTIP